MGRSQNEVHLESFDDDVEELLAYQNVNLLDSAASSRGGKATIEAVVPLPGSPSGHSGTASRVGDSSMHLNTHSYQGISSGGNEPHRSAKGLGSGAGAGAGDMAFVESWSQSPSCSSRSVTALSTRLTGSGRPPVSCTHELLANPADQLMTPTSQRSTITLRSSGWSRDNVNEQHTLSHTASQCTVQYPINKSSVWNREQQQAMERRQRDQQQAMERRQQEEFKWCSDDDSVSETDMETTVIPGALRSIRSQECAASMRPKSAWDSQLQHQQHTPCNDPTSPKTLSGPPESAPAPKTMQVLPVPRPRDGAGSGPSPAAAAAADFGAAGDQAQQEPRQHPRALQVGEWTAQLQSCGTSLREAVQRPGPSTGLVHCRIKKVTSFFGASCSYQLSLEGNPSLLLAARKRKKNVTTSYVLSHDLVDLNKNEERCLAKLKANADESEFTLWGKSNNKYIKRGYASEDLFINFKPGPDASAQRSVDGALKLPPPTPKGGVEVAGHPLGVMVILPLPEGIKTNRPEQLGNLLELAITGDLPSFLESKVAVLSSLQAGTSTPDSDSARGAAAGGWGLSLTAFSTSRQSATLSDRYEGSSKSNPGSNLNLNPPVVLQFSKLSEDSFSLRFGYPLSAMSAFATALARIKSCES